MRRKRDLDEAAWLGRAAREILASQAFGDIMAKAREAIAQEWRDATTPQQREDLHAENRALDRLGGTLKRLTNSTTNKGTS
jgi:hypothetical protein